MVDVLADFDHEDGASLLASFRERGTRMAEAINAARDARVPVIYVNDEHDRWDSDAPALAHDAAVGPGGHAVRPLLPRPGDRVLLKHRYSAFDHTALELLLAALGAKRVLIVGSATEGCVVQTAIDAREHGLKATILADACATTDAQLEETALRYAKDVGGIRVRRGVSPAARRGAERKRMEAVMPNKRSNVKNEKQYEALKDKGMSKERAARIANSPGSSSRGGKSSHSGSSRSSSSQGGTTAQKKAAGRKGGKAAARKS